jgi:antitoxin component of MazEF toxin-antitoxin module
MSRRKVENRQIRKLSKSRNSVTMSMSIPIDIIKELKWRAGQKVVVKKHGEGFLVTDWKEYCSFLNYTTHLVKQRCLTPLIHNP